MITWNNYLYMTKRSFIKAVLATPIAALTSADIISDQKYGFNFIGNFDTIGSIPSTSIISSMSYLSKDFNGLVGLFSFGLVRDECIPSYERWAFAVSNVVSNVQEVITYLSTSYIQPMLTNDRVFLSYSMYTLISEENITVLNQWLIDNKYKIDIFRDINYLIEKYPNTDRESIMEREESLG